MENLDIPRMSAFVTRFVNNLKRTGKSIHTLSAYRNDLGLFLDFLQKTGQNIAVWNQNLSDNWIEYLHANGRNSAASTRRALMSIRTFLHFLVQEKVIESSPLLETKSPRQPTHDLLTITKDHFNSVLQYCYNTAASGDEKAIRDLAIVLTLGVAGLKATEAAMLTWGDVFLPIATDKKSDGSIIVRGHNERVVPIDSDFIDILQKLKTLRVNLSLSVEKDDRLFFGYLNLSRQTRTAALHRHGIKFVVYELCSEILGVPYNSESLRNHAISLWLEKDLTAQRVADLAGYSSLQSLEKFSLDIRTTRIPKRNMPKANRI